MRQASKIIVIFSFILIGLLSCKSSKPKVALNSPRYKVVYEGNRILRTNVVENVEFETVELSDVTETPQEITPLEHESNINLPTNTSAVEDAFKAKNVHEKEALSIEKTQSENRPENRGALGLGLSIAAILLFFLGGGTQVFLIQGLAVVLLLFGFAFSLMGLKGNDKNAAIAGLIISGAIIGAALLALVLVLIRG